jgi:nucleoside-diphosphate-sugar epimerase
MALILVTGATGHIGNVLVHALSRRYPGENIRVFSSPERVWSLLTVLPCSFIW